MGEDCDEESPVCKVCGELLDDSAVDDLCAGCRVEFGYPPPIEPVDDCDDPWMLWSDDPGEQDDESGGSWNDDWLQRGAESRIDFDSGWLGEA